MDARQALLAAAREAWRDRQINLLELLLVRRACACWGCCLRSQAVLVGEAVTDEILDQARSRGRLAAGAAAEGIDWEKLAAFIKEVLPVILEFIKELLRIFG